MSYGFSVPGEDYARRLARALADYGFPQVARHYLGHGSGPTIFSPPGRPVLAQSSPRPDFADLQSMRWDELDHAYLTESLPELTSDPATAPALTVCSPGT